MKNNLKWGMVIACMCIGPNIISGANNSAEHHTYWLPDKVITVESPILSLNGEWELKYSAKSKWTKVEVPGEVAMQGYAIEHDKPFLYRKRIVVPKEYAGKRVILRFDGVYSYARLKINGKFVREHWGGFTRWETDVTSFLKIGGKNEIVLEVTDRLDEISYASGYAHHPIGGILRDVTLFAMPENHLHDIYVETDLDSLYKDAELRVKCVYEGSLGADVVFSLIAPDGKEVRLPENKRSLKVGENEYSFNISNPLKWDAEHPHLYTLKVSLQKDGKVQTVFSRSVGFREVEVSGDRMLVNGRQVKLRGACRHDIHPKLGRTTSAELDSLDVVLFKEANMNFVRTSHYPPTERFLQYCDRYGIYVESESAVCFVDTHRQKNYAPGRTQNDTAYTHRYLGQCQEMVKAFRSHPSILFWSIGNESMYGTNFQLCYDWVKKTDRTRPVIFSYPGTVPADKKIFDILSMHYQDVYGNLEQWGKVTRGFQGEGIPVVFDEWAHPACYTYATLRTDPNIREFWGKSLDMMWSGLFDARGGLGGAIWGYIDETFALPEPKVGEAYWKEFAHTAKPEGFRGNCVGYGEWGIVDVWRRKKPEFWSTKKAYSPVRLMTEREVAYTAGQPVVLTVYNRFDHTNLNEIKAVYTYKGQQGEAILSAVDPHQKGILTIPEKAWEEGELVQIEFYSKDNSLIDKYQLVLGSEEVQLPAAQISGALSISEDAEKVLVKGNNFEIPFDKETGLIVNAKVGDEVLIQKGPFLNAYVNLNHLSGAEVRKIADHYAVLETEWKKTSFSYHEDGNCVYVTLKGTYKDIKVSFRIKVTASGELSVNYTTDRLPNGFLRETGLLFWVNDDIKTLDWKRKGYWDYYPEGELSGNEGTVSLYNVYKPLYGERPEQPWVMDTHNYYYWSDKGAACNTPLTQIAKGMKENIYYYTLCTLNHKLSVISPDASVACRMDKAEEGTLKLYINNRWDYPEIAWGNFCKTLEALPCYGEINIRLN
jgi:beta-galactosidase